MNVIIIQSEKDFEYLNKYINKGCIYFAWHPQAVDACNKRNLNFLTLEDIALNKRSKIKYSFVKEITNVFKNLDKKIKKKYKEQYLNFFINLSSYSRRIFFTYFNETEKLEFLIKFFHKKKIYICRYNSDILNPLSIILKNLKIKNLKIIDTKIFIENFFIRKEIFFNFFKKGDKGFINSSLINTFYNLFNCIFKKHLSIKDYLRFLLSKFSLKKKNFFLVSYLGPNELSIIEKFKKKNFYPIYLDWISSDFKQKKLLIKKKDIFNEISKIELKYYHKDLRENLKNALFLITQKIHEENFFYHFKIFKRFKKITNLLKINFALSKYINEPKQALCFDLMKKKKLYGMFHGGGTYLFNYNPISDINFSSNNINIFRFIDNNFVSSWVRKQNNNINKMKFDYKITGSSYFLNLNKKQKNLNSQHIYIASNFGMGEGCDNKWANYDDASYYKFLIKLCEVASKKNINLKLKFRRINILKNLDLNKKIKNDNNLEFLYQNFLDYSKKDMIYLTSHYSTHMHELIMLNSNIIFLFKKKAHSINKKFFKSLKNIVKIETNEFSFFKKINYYKKFHNINIKYLNNFKKNFITDLKIDPNKEIFNTIYKNLKNN